MFRSGGRIARTSHEPFETLLFRFAYRAYFRRTTTCTQVAAYAAPPYREWQWSSFAGLLHLRLCRAFFWRRSSFRNHANALLTVDDIRRYVQSAVTRTILDDIGIAVVTRAYDIEVGVFLTGGESARTCLIPVALHVDDQAADKILGEFIVWIEMVSACFGFLLQVLPEILYTILSDFLITHAVLPLVSFLHQTPRRMSDR